MQKRNWLYTLSFFEGGCVMATELMSAKLLAPYFGTSLYVWSAVMAATLIALAAGYFFGGVLSQKSSKEINLYTMAAIGGLFVILMPFTIKLCIALFGYTHLLVAVTLSSILLIVPPLLIMGAISPLIISLIADQNINAGYVSGSVYAISTLGGILFTFLFGFYIIPTFGLKIPSFVTGCCFTALAFYLLYTVKKHQSLLSWILFALIVSGYYTFRKKDNPFVNIIHKEYSLFGEILVADFKNTPAKERILAVNNYVQTYDCAGSCKHVYFNYHRQIHHTIAANYHTSSPILLLGIGGGTLARDLYKNGYTRLQACEIDNKVYQAALRFFGLNKNIPVSIDDARHFINVMNEKYDVIVLDVFKAEEPAHYVSTQESLRKLKAHLSENGVLLFNVSGYLTGDKGLGNRSLLKTLLQQDYKIAVMPHGYDRNAEDHRNLYVTAALNDRTLSKAKACFINTAIPLTDIDLNDAEILTDEKPSDKLFAASAMAWRTHTFWQGAVTFEE